MTEDKLIVFKRRKIESLLILLNIVFIILVFFFYAENIWNNINSETLNAILFMLTILIANFAANYFSSKKIFPEIGSIYLHDNSLILFDNSKENKTIINSTQKPLSIRFHYCHELSWKSSNAFLQNWKSIRRYMRKNEGFGTSRFDCIEINNHKILVKIRNENEKRTFFSIIEWSKNNMIENEIFDDNALNSYKNYR